MAAFCVDENVSLRVAALLRGQGHDVISLTEENRRAAVDPAMLVEAARESRIVITHNAKDFVLLHDVWRIWGTLWGIPDRHGGILIVPHKHYLPAADIAGEVSAFLAAGLPIANELYVWQRAGGWIRRPH